MDASANQKFGTATMRPGRSERYKPVLEDLCLTQSIAGKQTLQASSRCAMPSTFDTISKSTERPRRGMARKHTKHNIDAKTTSIPTQQEHHITQKQTFTIPSHGHTH